MVTSDIGKGLTARGSHSRHYANWSAKMGQRCFRIQASYVVENRFTPIFFVLSRKCADSNAQSDSTSIVGGIVALSYFKLTMSIKTVPIRKGSVFVNSWTNDWFCGFGAFSIFLMSFQGLAKKILQIEILFFFVWFWLVDSYNRSTMRQNH